MSGLLGVQKRIQLTSKQAAIYVWGWQPEARYRTAVCGRRFGKTFLMMEEMRRAVRLAVERNVDTDNEIWYGAPTLKQAEKNFWKRALRACPEEWIAGVNNSKHVINFHSGHTFRLVGLDNYDDLRGSGLFFFMGDEWADVKPAAWEEVVEPMLMTANGNAVFIGTPKGFNHFYDEYTLGQPGDGKDPERMSWKFSTLEGGNVPEHEITKKMRTSDERTFRQEYMASFETYAGIIYYAFDRTKNVVKWGYNSDRPVQVGLDFNIDPMTAHIYQERVEDGRIVSNQIDEIHIDSSNTHEMGNEIATRYGRRGFTGDVELSHITVYPDPAGAGRRTAAHGETDISILRKMGFKVWAMSSHPLVRDRINLVNGKFCSVDGTRSLFIDPSCRRSIAAVEKQSYKQGTSEPDKGEFDHDNDATGYYVYTRFAHQKARPEHVPHMGR
jgi:Terminase large subunit, T4likevirus-type, N-terminal